MKAVRRIGCLGVLLLVAAVCCAVPMGAALSAADTTSADDGGVVGPVDIPARMLTAYRAAARGVTRWVPRCEGMRWPVLAGVARIESNHAKGRSIAAGGDIRPRITGPRLDGSGAGGNTTAIRDTDDGRWDGDRVFDRAVGPFQFLPATFKGSGRDGNRDGVVDPHNADDAALAAAVYLCGGGRNLNHRGQLERALFAYNHSRAYVADVLGWIDTYDTAATGDPGLGNITGRARAVLAAALAQRGVPYSWGGGIPRGKSRGICCSPGGQDGTRVVGFDCSGLTLYAFARAGVTLPRTAAAQASIGRRIPASAGTGALEPGDLVFFGYLPTVDSTIHHVGIYLGHGRMINAPRPGTHVRIDPITALPDYAGGARVL